MSAVIKYLEKYGKNLSSKEFQKLVEKYNNDNRKPQNRSNILTFFPIMIGSRVVFGATFQDYKNEIERQLKSDFVELDYVKKEYQTKVIDKYKNALNTREIYQAFKQGNEPKLHRINPSIEDKYLFYSNVQSVKEVMKLEKYLKDLNQSNIEDTTKEDEETEVFTFKNNFNQVDTEDVYNHFYDLVKKDYLSKSDYEKYLKLAFEDQEKPSQKFRLKGDYYKKDIFKLFGNFYKMNGKEHGQKQMYSELLSNYFNGFDNAYSELTRDL